MKIKRQSVMILMLLVTLSPLGIDLHLPALTTIKQHFSINNSKTQLSILLFVLSMGIGQLVFGMLLGKIGKKKAGYIGFLLFIVSAFGVIAFDDFNVLLFFRFLQGLGASALGVIAYAAVNENYEGDEAAKIFAMQSGCLNIIPAIAPIIGALLLLMWEWQSIFIFFIAYGLIILFYFHQACHFIDDTTPQNALSSFSMLLKDKQFCLHAIVCILCLGYIMTYLNLSPMLVINEFGLTPLQFSLFFAINAIVISFFSFLMKKIIDVLGLLNCVIIGLLLMLTSSLSLWLAHNHMNYLLFFGLIVLGSIGFAFCFGCSIAIALSNHQDRSGIASGLLGFLYLSLSPIIAYFILHDSDYVGTKNFGLSFTVMILLIVAILLFTRHKARISVKH